MSFNEAPGAINQAPLLADDSFNDYRYRNSLSDSYYNDSTSSSTPTLGAIHDDNIPISVTDPGIQSDGTDESSNGVIPINTTSPKGVGTHSKENSVLSTVITYVCTTVGAGIISLPFAIREAGWFGVFILACVGVVCAQTAQWLVACMFAVPGQKQTTYEEIGFAAAGKIGRNIVTVFQLITLYGVCVIFLIIAGGNLSALFPQLSLHVWVFIVGVGLIPVAWLKTMREVAVLAYFGLFASLLVGTVIISKGLSDASQSKGSHEFIHWDGIPNCINVAVFSLGSHSVLPNQVNEMRSAHSNYRRMTIYAYLLISSIYIIVAACGYAGYGDDTQDNVLNSMSADGNSKITNVARAFIIAHVILAYPLPLNPVSLFVEQIAHIHTLPVSIITRTLLVIGTVFIASVVPYFGSILTLVSSLSIVVVAFVLPPIFYYLLYKDRGVITRLEITKMAVILCIGVASCVIGLYYAVNGLVADIETHPSPFENYFG